MVSIEVLRFRARHYSNSQQDNSQAYLESFKLLWEQGRALSFILLKDIAMLDCRTAFFFK